MEYVAKNICPECKGLGLVIVNLKYPVAHSPAVQVKKVFIPCPRCKGTGVLTATSIGQTLQKPPVIKRKEYKPVKVNIYGRKQGV